MKRGEDLGDLLMDLALLVLCRHVHQKGQRSQVPGLVKKWQGQILGVTENLDNVETIYGGREVKHMDIRRETNELEASRRVDRFSLSSRLQPSWHENLPLQVDVEASSSSKLEVDRRARPFSSNDAWVIHCSFTDPSFFYSILTFKLLPIKAFTSNSFNFKFFTYHFRPDGQPSCYYRSSF
ncbi:hypothetical protein ASPACDRAFT_41808 [Aspergillus aculeatus ATCC 16872]|uniref:Uncharacterized protein n=1 Tax=Aspergillus aculeatus (strain ATCC 16872 / CBS 172.66 / WB 5094) TaxID=690307 RepID=A0A1L9WZ53_ASPA1|nr:uncharacterized protein ASPACDRAFT_41808 [Aspergillus aculeatus ATCC 16872]OJK01545.1 hypothetical protein ASPACDRAFT_41808 [Aspergillus aculeatus ATCC 16872]